MMPEPPDYTAAAIQLLREHGITLRVVASTNVSPPTVAVLETRHNGTLRLFYSADIDSSAVVGKLTLIGLGKTYISMGETHPADNQESVWTPLFPTGRTPEGVVVPEDMFMLRLAATTKRQFRKAQVLVELGHRLLAAENAESAKRFIARMKVSEPESQFLFKMWKNYISRRHRLCPYWHVMSILKVPLVNGYFRSFGGSVVA